MAAPATTRKPTATEGDRRPKGLRELGVHYWLTYPRPICQFRQSERFTQEQRVFECVLEHTMGHEFQSATAQIRQKNGAVRFMGQADIARLLDMDKGNVSRQIDSLTRRGLIRTEGRKIFLVGDPKAENAEKANKRRTKVVCTNNLSPFVLPEDDPRREAWMSDLQVLEASQKAAIAAAVKVVRLAFKARRTAIAEKYLNGLQHDTSDPAVPLSNEEWKNVSKVVCTDNLSPDVRPCTNNKNGPVRCQDRQPIYKKENNRACAPAAGEQASSSPPASPPALPSPDDSRIQEIAEAVNAVLLEKPAPPLKPDDPKDRKLLEEIAGRLQGAPVEALQARIRNRLPDLQGPRMIPLLAADVAHITPEQWNARKEAPGGNAGANQWTAAEEAYLNKSR